MLDGPFRLNLEVCNVTSRRKPPLTSNLQNHYWHSHIPAIETLCDIDRGPSSLSLDP